MSEATWCRECYGAGVAYSAAHDGPGERFVEPPPGPDICGPCRGTGRTRPSTDPPIDHQEGN
jgi:hypothetical protein